MAGALNSFIRIDNSMFVHNSVNGSGIGVYGGAMRVKSMVMVNNCGVLNNKAVGRDGAVPEGGAFCVEGVSANLTVSASMLKENSAVGDACGTDACGGALAAKQGATITIKAVNMSSSVVRGAQRSLGGALCVRSSSVAIELTDFEANQA